MTGRPLSLTLAALVSLLSAIPVAVQGLERVPPPIDVHVSATSSSGGENEVVSNGDVTVTWKLDVKACTPECQ